jgi:hypothetical protein
MRLKRPAPPRTRKLNSLVVREALARRAEARARRNVRRARSYLRTWSNYHPLLEPIRRNGLLRAPGIPQ